VAHVEAGATTELALVPAATVRGHVAIDGALPANATVHVLPLALDQVTRTATLDEHGAFSLTVPAGRWRVETDVPGYAQPAEQIVELGDRATDLDVPLLRTGSVAGTVVDGAGTPVGNATIVMRVQ